MDITTAQFLDSLGWAVIHSVWQGALAALAVFTFRSATKDSQAGLRCGFELIALGLCFAAFAFTFTSNFFAPATPQITLPSLVDIVSAPLMTTVETDAAPQSMAMQARSVVQYTPLLGILWCLGFLLLATRYTVGFALTHRLRTRGLTPAPQPWQTRFETLVLNSGIFRNVTLHISNRVPSPVTLGFFKPVVLVPASFFARLPADQIEAILLHEIAHIRRHDYFINLIQTAIKSILFFHPAIHYICRAIDEDREKACDDFAVKYTKNPAALAKGLATIRLNQSAPDFAMAATNPQNPLLRRLTRLTTPEESRRRPGQVVTTLAALLVAAGIYANSQIEFAHAHPPERTQESLSLSNTNQDSLHVSGDKKNYHFATTRHDGRDITFKIASNGSRWVFLDDGWHDIDKNSDILGRVPMTPIAPRMPRPDDYNSVKKFEKDMNQYRVNLDYYIASLKNSKDKKSEKALHWARKQKSYINAPKSEFNMDYLHNTAVYKEAALKPAGPTTPPPRPAATPKPARLSADAELAGRPPVKPGLYLDSKHVSDLEDWDDAENLQTDRLTDKFEIEMDKIEIEFEQALAKLEIAAEEYSLDPENNREKFQTTQKEFAEVVVISNQKRDALSKKLDQDINRIVSRHTEKATQHALNKARREAENARIKAENAHTALAQSRDSNAETVSDAYKISMMNQLKSDKLIRDNATAAEILFKNGLVFVDGKKIPHSMEDNYCKINAKHNIKKTDHMKVELAPTRLTITKYKN